MTSTDHDSTPCTGSSAIASGFWSAVFAEISVAVLLVGNTGLLAGNDQTKLDGTNDDI